MKGKRAKKEAEKKAEKAALAEKRRLQQEEFEKSRPAKGGNKGGNNKGGKKPEGDFKGRTAAVTATAATDAVEDPEAVAPPLDANANEDEVEEVRRLLQEENIKMLEPEESENLTVLDGLTGKPLPTDILQFAIPVCAPYGALQKYKYKVKLIPGTMKKGKAVKTAINHFLVNINGNNSASSTSSERSVVEGGGLSGAELREAEAALEAREKELIKMLKDEEAINAMIGKSKVSAPGVEASKKKSGGGGGKGRK